MKTIGSLTASLLLLCAVLLVPAKAADGEDALTTIRERGVVRVALSHSPPNLVKDVTTGEWSGAWPDLFRSIFGSIDVEVEFVDTPWGSMVPGLQSGNVDLAVLAILPNRAVTVDYSDPVDFSPIAVLVPEGDPEETVTWSSLDREGFRISVLAGGAAEQMLRRMLQRAELVAAVDYNDSWLQLQTDRADAMTGYVHTVEGYARDRGEGVVLVPEPSVGLATAITFRPGNPALKRFLNAGIVARRMDGSLRAFFARTGTADYLYGD